MQFNDKKKTDVFAKRPVHVLADSFFMLPYSSSCDLWNRHLSGTHKFHASTLKIPVYIFGTDINKQLRGAFDQ